MHKKKILVVGPTALSIIHFRKSLIKKMIENNFTVTVAVGSTELFQLKEIESWGVKTFSYNVINNRVNLFNEIKAIIQLRSIIKDLDPSIIFAYTFKSIIYSSLFIKKKDNIDFIPLITGLGYSFFGNSVLKFIIRNIILLLFKYSLNKSKVIIFQNEDNLEFFNRNKITKKIPKKVIKGSGVDSNFFDYCSIPLRPIKFIMIARLLKEKGVLEYLRAADIVKTKYPNNKFLLVGDFDTSFDSIEKKDLDFFLKKGTIEYLGYSKKIKELLCDSHVFVLPSYHEGMPRSVLEAMSIGRPIITSNASGCKDTVRSGVNGFLVEIKDYLSLASKMEWFIENPNKIKDMGINSRHLVMNIFDNNIINNQFMKVLNEFR